MKPSNSLIAPVNVPEVRIIRVLGLLIKPQLAATMQGLGFRV